MICIIHFGSPKIKHIVESFEELGYSTAVIPWNEPEKIDKKNVQAYVLSGSPILITETDISQQIKNYTFLKDGSVPVLGICFGHQLLGKLFGAEIYKSEEIRTETEISILAEDQLFKGFAKKTVMTEDHTEGTTLPHNFIHLASSDKYNVEAMRHPALPLFGVQFHPEVSKKNGLKLLDNFCKLITK